MTRGSIRVTRGLLVAGSAALLVLLGRGAAAPAAGSAPARPRHLVIAVMPGVAWEDADAGQAPTLLALGQQWSMAALSIRTAADHTDAASAMTTIGAGNRARGTTRADNAGLHFGAVPGALGAALHAHGLRTSASDATAALAVGDRSGTVDVSDPLQADVAAVNLLDGEAGLSALVSRLDLSRDTLIVVSPWDAPGSPDRLMAATMAGVGALRGGWITSATTHRNGLITLPDLAPAVLGLFGITPPPSMTGQAAHTVPAGTGRLPRLLGVQAAALSYDRRIVPFNVALGAIGTLVFLGGWRRLRLRRGARASRGRGRAAGVGGGLGRPGALRAAGGGGVGGGRPDALQAAGLLVAAVPLACLAQAAVGGERWPALPAFAFLVGAALAVLAVALVGPWRRSPLGPPAFIGAATAAAIVGDLLTGSRGQLTSLIGYSPIVAGRFYGLSPVSFATLATATLLVAGLAAGARPRWAVGIVVGVGALTIGVAGAPMLGAKFGSILTLVPAFGLLGLLVSGRRLSLTKAVVLGAAAAVVAVGIGLLDALRPAQSQTHIGRFVSALLGGGPGSVGDVLLRKLDANLGIYVRTPVALLVPVALALVGVAVLRPGRVLEAPLRSVPGLRPGLLAAAVAMGLGLVLNDSGAAIPAMGMAFGVPLAVAILAPASAAEPVPAPAAAPPG